MSTFDHTTLMQDINAGLSPLRKAQPEAMAGFGQLARAAMAEGALSAKHKELMQSTVLVNWGKRCGKTCAQEWNDTVGKVVGLAIPLDKL